MITENDHDEFHTRRWQDRWDRVVAFKRLSDAICTDLITHNSHLSLWASCVAYATQRVSISLSITLSSTCSLSSAHYQSHSSHDSHVVCVLCHMMCSIIMMLSMSACNHSHNITKTWVMCWTKWHRASAARQHEHWNVVERGAKTRCTKKLVGGRGLWNHFSGPRPLDS